MRRIVKELMIFGAVFVVLALAMHADAWVDHPLEQVAHLPQSSLGVWHPLYISLGVYLLLLALRTAVGAVVKFFKRG